MTALSQPPAAIEGDRILIAAQDIKPNGRPRIIPDSSEMVFPIDIKRRCKSEIIVQAQKTEPEFRPYSLLNAGDSISGRIMWGFSSDPVGPNDLKIGGKGRTSNHPGQELEIRGTCFMELICGWKGSPLPVHPKQLLLE